MTQKATSQKVFDTTTLPYGGVKRISEELKTPRQHVTKVLNDTKLPRGPVAVKILKLAKQMAQEHLNSITF